MSSLIDQIQDELLKLGEDPAKMLGCTPEQIEELKAIQGVSKLPGLYQEFLLKMGRGAGTLFQGTAFYYGAMKYFNFKQDAQDLLREKEVLFQMPHSGFVFLIHQGYIFMYFDTDAQEYDPILYRYIEGDPSPKPISNLSKLFLEEIKLHKSLQKMNKL